MNHNDLFRYDSEIGYTFIPNLKARVPHETGAYLLRTNALGFRSDVEPGGTGKEVFVFGDSFTAGDGVSNGKRWTDELGRLLPEAKIHNFGLPGSGTDQQFLAWRKFARGRPCDLLIVAVLVENIRRITSAFRPVETPEGDVRFKAKPYFSLDDGRLVPHHLPVPKDPVSADELNGAATDTGGRYQALRRIVTRLGLKDAVQRLTAYQPVPDFDDALSEGWQLMRAIIGEWSRECDCPMAVVPLPLYHHVEELADASAYQARFSELAADFPVTVIDPLPDLRRYDIKQRRNFRFAKDVHLTAEGHAAIARALAPAVERALKTSA